MHYSKDKAFRSGLREEFEFLRFYGESKGQGLGFGFPIKRRSGNYVVMASYAQRPLCCCVFACQPFAVRPWSAEIHGGSGMHRSSSTSRLSSKQSSSYSD